MYSFSDGKPSMQSKLQSKRLVIAGRSGPQTLEVQRQTLNIDVVHVPPCAQGLHSADSVAVGSFTRAKHGVRPRWRTATKPHIPFARSKP